MQIRQWMFDMNNLADSFNEWEADIAKYHSEQTTPFPDEVKICVLCGRTKGAVYNHLMFHTCLYMPYKESRIILISYFGTGRLMRDVQHHSTISDRI